MPLGHQWHRATRCSWTLLWRRACLAHVHIVWNQLTWHIRIPFFPYFSCTVKSMRNPILPFFSGQVLHQAFFSLVLMGWFRVLFWKIHTCHIQFMFFIGQIPEKNDRIWICNSNQTTTFRTKVSTSVSIELRRFRHEKRNMSVFHRLGAPTRPCCPTKSLAPARRLPRSVALDGGNLRKEIGFWKAIDWIQYIETIGHVILIYGNSYIYIESYLKITISGISIYWIQYFRKQYIGFDVWSNNVENGHN